MECPFVVFDKTKPRKGVALHLTYRQVRSLHNLIGELLSEDTSVFTVGEAKFFKALHEELEGL